MKVSRFQNNIDIHNKNTLEPNFKGNKMIKKDVEKDVQAGVNVKNSQSAIAKSNIIKPMRMEDFIKS